MNSMGIQLLALKYNCRKRWQKNIEMDKLNAYDAIVTAATGKHGN